MDIGAFVGSIHKRGETLRSRYVYAIGVTMAALGLAALALPGVAAAQDVGAEIEKLRQASKRFNDVKVALAEGYIPAPPGDCVDAAHEGLPAKWGPWEFTISIPSC